MNGSETFLFLPPSLRRFRPQRLSHVGWTEELPLAYDLVEAMRPGLIVAIGTLWGATYYAYCQSAVEHEVDTMAFGIGKWKKGRGQYSGRDLYEDFCAHGREYYSGFSYPVLLPNWPGKNPSYGRPSQHFSKTSIDLFHIDEEAQGDEARAEIDRWYPKLRPGGIMVVHDIGEPGTDLRSHWESLGEHDDTFVFEGPPPLGVLRKTGEMLATEPLLLRLMFSDSTRDHDDLRRLYRRAARFTELEQLVGRGEFGRAGDPTQQTV